MRIRKKPHISGITLIELMIVVAIFAVLAAIAAPDLRAFFVNVRLTSANNEFVAVLNLARNEAIRRGVPVTLRRCDVVDLSLGCTETSLSGEWTKGWYLFADVDGNRSRDTSAGSREEVIRIGQRISQPMSLWSGQPSEDFLQFAPDGRVAFPVNATFLLCYDGHVERYGQQWSRAILVNASGRVRQGWDASTNRPEYEDGTDMSDSNCGRLL